MPELISKFYLSFVGVLLSIVSETSTCYGQKSEIIPKIQDNAFPICVQFSPVPSGEGWKDEKSPLTEEIERETIHNIIKHGFSLLSVGSLSTNPIENEKTVNLLNYAQSLGMKVSYITHGFEMFDRIHPPAVSVYSPMYGDLVKNQVLLKLDFLNKIDQIHSVFPFQDEPFHVNPESFDYSDDAKVEFYKRYGYSMPLSLDSVLNDPKKWLDLLNFQSNTFRDGWLQVYQIVKDFDPRPQIIITHDSHNTFGAGVKSNSQVAMDDVFHWGGCFADMYIYDCYPYMQCDFRYGEFGKLPKPRISQMHYTLSQLRNVTTTYGKNLGFWVGTYNKTWFRKFIGPERRNAYWGERETAYTAIAQGANFIITGLNIPEDSMHWEDFGKSMRIIQEAGPGLIEAPKVKANACFLFPRSQYLLLQEEYFNVGLSFELVLRAFGELDIIHEEQIKDNKLNGYKILILCDVKLLPAEVAEHIEGFVREGGIVLADCVPQMDEYKMPLDIMTKLFDISRSSTDRIVREGQLVPYTTISPKWWFVDLAEQKKIEFTTDNLDGRVFGHTFGFSVVTPRACDVANGRSMLNMQSGLPALVYNEVGKGRTYLLNFSLQETYFKTWKDSDVMAREQLSSLLSNIFQDAKIHSHIYSSNPDIEASIRANSREGYIFIINHEAAESRTSVRLCDLQFRVGQIIDIESERSIEFKQKKETIEFQINAPIGDTRLLRIQPL